MQTLETEISEFLRLLPNEVPDHDDKKAINEELETFADYFISKYRESTHDESFTRVLSSLTTDQLIYNLLDSRRCLENATFLKLMIIWCSLGTLLFPLKCNYLYYMI